MTEGPIRIGSFLTYQIAISLLVIIWAFIGFEVAQFHLLPLYESPHTWIAWAVIVLVSMIPVIMPVIWRMKTQIIFVEPEWEFREREVSQSEYSAMMKQYRSEYRDFLSIVDYRLLLVASIIALTAVTLPFLLMRTTFVVIAATPVIFGMLVLLFGLVCSSILIKYIPNEATAHFPIVPDRVLRESIELMEKTPGISWAGVSLSLGEASGYYTIRNMGTVSRIEGIESAAKMQGIMDESGVISKVVVTLNLDDAETSKVIGETSGEISQKQLAELIHQTLTAYIESTSADEILDEVLEEVTFFMNRFKNDDYSHLS